MTPPLRWNETEKEHLKAHYSAIGARRLADLLPGRSEAAIMEQAWRMNLGKCRERLAELGRENVAQRHDRQPMSEPPDISA